MFRHQKIHTFLAPRLDCLFKRVRIPLTLHVFYSCQNECKNTLYCTIDLRPRSVHKTQTPQNALQCLMTSPGQSPVIGQFRLQHISNLILLNLFAKNLEFEQISNVSFLFQIIDRKHIYFVKYNQQFYDFFVVENTQIIYKDFSLDAVARKIHSGVVIKMLISRSVISLLYLMPTMP